MNKLYLVYHQDEPNLGWPTVRAMSPGEAYTIVSNHHLWKDTFNTQELLDGSIRIIEWGIEKNLENYYEWREDLEIWEIDHQEIIL
jgi:hypothetical protein